MLVSCFGDQKLGVRAKSMGLTREHSCYQHCTMVRESSCMNYDRQIKETKNKSLENKISQSKIKQGE